MTSSDCSSDDFEYEIKQIDENDEIQINNFLISTKMYNDTNKVYELTKNDAYKACCNDFIFAFLSVVNYKDIEQLLDKKIKENINKMFNKMQKNEKHIKIDTIQFLVHKKICNAPYISIIDLHKKMKKKIENVIIISQCNILSKSDYENVCQNFSEYRKEDLKCYPINEEEIFFSRTIFMSMFLKQKINNIE